MKKNKKICIKNLEISKKSTIFAQNSCHFRQNNWRKNMETKIASYQEKGVRLQLIAIIPEDEYLKKNNLKPGIKCYQIRKNRKIVDNYRWEWGARQRFEQLIREELLK